MYTLWDYIGYAVGQCVWKFSTLSEYCISTSWGDQGSNPNRGRKISGDFFNLPKYWTELPGMYVDGR